MNVVIESERRILDRRLSISAVGKMRIYIFFICKVYTLVTNCNYMDIFEKKTVSVNLSLAFYTII